MANPSRSILYRPLDRNRLYLVRTRVAAMVTTKEQSGRGLA